MIKAIKDYFCKSMCSGKYKDKVRVPFQHYPQISELPIKEDSMLFWDIENIDHTQMAKIYMSLGYMCEMNYIVTHNKLTMKALSRLLKLKDNFNVKIITSKTDADTEIKRLMNRKILKTKNIVVVTSDSDFANNINFVTANPDKTCTVVLKEIQKKAMIMRAKIDRNNLKIVTI